MLFILCSCKSTQDKINEILSDYVKTKVRNPNSVVIHKFQVFDMVDGEDSSIFVEESKTNTINTKTKFITFIFSAKNTDGNEVYRKASVYLSNDKKSIEKSFPEKIDIEDGNLSGTCKFYLGNLRTNWQIQDYSNGANITILNVDTLGGKKKYITKVQNGTYQINKITPGNYFIKIIDYSINLENIYSVKGENKNKSILFEISNIMNFYQIYAGSDQYGYSDEKLFNITLKRVEAINANINDFIIFDSDVSSIWGDFKKSINKDFLEDFDIEDDYRYLNDFIKITIEPSVPTNQNFDVKKFFF